MLRKLNLQKTCDNMKSKILPFLAFITLALTLIISLFMLMSDSNEYVWHTLLLNLAIDLPLCCLLSYADYLLIQFFHKRFYRHIGWLAFMVDLLLSSCVILAFSFPFIHFFNTQKAAIQIFGLLLMNLSITLFFEVILSIESQHEGEIRLLKAEQKNTDYQYSLLKSQVNPHFLFNSLNVLSSLAYESADETNLFAKRLAMVYRYLLTTSKEKTVDIVEELNFVKHYVYLEKVRFGDALQVKIEDKADGERRVFPVSIQILIENALKHNVVSPKYPLTIVIVADENGVNVSHPLQPRNNVDKSGYGLSLLSQQYAVYQQEIKVEEHQDRYKTFLPYVDFSQQNTSSKTEPDNHTL